RPALGGKGAQHRGEPGVALTERALEAFGAQALRVVVIMLLAWAILALAERLIRLFRTQMARRTGADEITRVETLARVFHYTTSIVIFIVAGAAVLDTLGISIAPLLATAGVAGLAIGFGAPSLIK